MAFSPPPVRFDLDSAESETLRQLRLSLSDFRAMLASLPDNQRSVEHNQQFNQFRTETIALLGGEVAQEVPPAITGDTTTDRSISLIVVGGVLVALVGLGMNALVPDDLLVNGFGCLTSLSGTLLVAGGFGVLAYKNYQERVNSISQLRERTDLLMLQIDHRLRLGNAYQ
ncbi:MAG TPA: hypothetical protein PKE64_20700 [Anaerolineae bacterium]|nr:hypothetical protein [Anaerolineae bacterium]